MYTILPFNFSRLDDEYLLVNSAGVHHFLHPKAFTDFVRHALPEDSDDYMDLQSKLFAASGSLDLSVRQLAARYRTRMEFLKDFTALHMMVITLRCNQRCEYCQASCADEDAAKYDMPIGTAEKIVDFIFSSPTYEFLLHKFAFSVFRKREELPSA